MNRSGKKVLIFAALALVALIGLFVLIALTAGGSQSRAGGSDDPAQVAAGTAAPQASGTLAAGEYRGPVMAARVPAHEGDVRAGGGEGTEEIRFKVDAGDVTARVQPMLAGEGIDDVAQLYSDQGKLKRTKVGSQLAYVVVTRDSGRAAVLVMRSSKGHLVSVMVTGKSADVEDLSETARRMSADVKVTAETSP